MHLEFITAGIHTPYTILLPPFIEQPLIPELDLTPLGQHFVIKPSNEGGGEGVILGAFSMDQILRARMEFPEQKYLVQATITPRTIHGQPAWFRSFMPLAKRIHAGGIHSRTSLPLSREQDENRYELSALHEITQRIASICKLDWFSTEIALHARRICRRGLCQRWHRYPHPIQGGGWCARRSNEGDCRQLVLIAKGETHDNTRT